ncbi:P-loop containing nucleoside triphosphate hydrolase protein [Fusarium redolens]|uniref:P-loop containing nucleoside triphosphate hydrolase protein n=1 Tax=Fusarium redolens TaxID=48865 RepID=A0A9P9R617_FUSRE|nr:P-loop containing nucleoside triphosphate hydrolase protein [Fusarium redolens]KAH7267008.1 P-loop containing nucleoside triphosphate hydrolase protein [Fusarium redolens]
MEKWFPFLEAEDTPIFSPRVEAILAKVKSIRELWPDENIVIVSEFVLFLDIIKQGMKQCSKTDDKFKIPLAEYNGTVDLENRSWVQFTFNLPTGRPEVLLLSPGAGGLSLNLARATYVIITEPFRTPGTLQQVIERAYRLPQEKTVHVAGFNLTLSIARSSIIQAPEGLCIILHT